MTVNKMPRSSSNQPEGGKKRQVTLSVKDKLKVIELCNLGRSAVSIAREFGIGASTVCDIRKKKVQYMKYMTTSDNVVVYPSEGDEANFLLGQEIKLETMSAFASKSGRAVHPQSTPSGAAPGGNTELASLFECPVCFDYVLPPILQCQSGHLVCATCRPKLTCCPTCRGPLGNIRNLAMEKVASTVMFPCKYSSSGCSATLLHTDKTEHEDTCEFRPYMCPCPGASCKWQGSLEQVMPHLMSAHKSITTLQGEDIVFLATDINLPGAVDWVMMQSCFGHHFMLVLEKQEKYDGHQQFFAIVQLIGSRKQAENFAYRLELNGPRRRLTWEATPRSIHEGVQSAIMNSDCLVFDTSIAQLFADNGNLGINVTISMC